MCCCRLHRQKGEKAVSEDAAVPAFPLAPAPRVSDDDVAARPQQPACRPQRLALVVHVGKARLEKDCIHRAFLHCWQVDDVAAPGINLHVEQRIVLLTWAWTEARCLAIAWQCDGDADCWLTRIAACGSKHSTTCQSSMLGDHRRDETICTSFYSRSNCGAQHANATACSEAHRRSFELVRVQQERMPTHPGLIARVPRRRVTLRDHIQHRLCQVYRQNVLHSARLQVAASSESSQSSAGAGQRGASAWCLAENML
jgi:hypothetical protein